MADATAGRSEPTQLRVRRALGRLGGYWRPLAALARVLEELGELAELLAEPSPGSGSPRAEPSGGEPSRSALASELADLWIITTALADQFLARVAEPGVPPAPPASPPPLLAGDDPIAGLAVVAGRIARMVNYYDGPKTPRSLDGWRSLGEEVTELQLRLAAIAHAHALDLAAAIERKLEAICARDAGRFEERGWHDPSTAACLQRLRLRLHEPAGAPARGRTRLWGAPAWSHEPIAQNAAAIAPALVAFTRAAPLERLDAFVIAGPPFASPGPRARWLDELLRELRARDPQRAHAAPQGARAAPKDGERGYGGAQAAPRHEQPDGPRPGAPHSRIAFNGVELAVETLPPRSAGERPGAASAETFVVLSVV